MYLLSNMASKTWAIFQKFANSSEKYEINVANFWLLLLACVTPKNGRSWFYSTLTRLITLSCLFRLWPKSFKKRQNSHITLFWNVFIDDMDKWILMAGKFKLSYINKVSYIFIFYWDQAEVLNTYFAEKIKIFWRFFLWFFLSYIGNFQEIFKENIIQNTRFRVKRFVPYS